MYQVGAESNSANVHLSNVYIQSHDSGQVAMGIKSEVSTQSHDTLDMTSGGHTSQQLWPPDNSKTKLSDPVGGQSGVTDNGRASDEITSYSVDANLLSNMPSSVQNTNVVHTHVMPPSVDHAGYVAMPDKFSEFADVFQSVGEPINEVVIETAPSTGFQCDVAFCPQQMSSDLHKMEQSQAEGGSGQSSFELSHNSNSAEESEPSFEDQPELVSDDLPDRSWSKHRLTEQLSKTGEHGHVASQKDRNMLHEPTTISSFDKNKGGAVLPGRALVEVHRTLEGQNIAGKGVRSNVLVQKLSHHLSKSAGRDIALEDLTGRLRASCSGSDQASENEACHSVASMKACDVSDEETIDNGDYFVDHSKALEIDLKSENQPMKHRRKCKATVKRLTGEELRRKVREPVRLSEATSSREPIKVVLKRRSKRKSAQLAVPKRERSLRQRQKKKLPPSHVSPYESRQEASEMEDEEEEEEDDGSKEANSDEDYVCKISKNTKSEKPVLPRRKNALKSEELAGLSPPPRRYKEDGTPEKYDVPDLIRAVDYVLRHGVPITHASRMFGIPRKTLDDHVKGRSPFGKPRGPERTLNRDEEQGIVKQLEEAAALGMPINRKRVRAAVLQMTRSLGREIRFSSRGPSDKWLRGFYERNPNLLKLLSIKPEKEFSTSSFKPPEDSNPDMNQLLQIFAEQCAEEQKPKKRGKHYQYSTDDLQIAIDKVKCDGMAVSQAAKKYNVPRTTLKDHVAGKPSAGRRPGPDPTFSDEDEESLVQHIEYLKTRGFGVSRKEIRSLIMELLNKTGRKWHFRDGGPSDKWFRGFYERYPHLADKQVSKKSKNALTRSTDLQWFKELSETVARLELNNKPSQIFNCSEIGFAHRYQPWEVATEGEVRVHMCVSAIGSVLPSMIVYEKTLPKVAYADECSPEWKFGVSENGHMSKALFAEWFSNIFLDFCGKRRPLLLLMENQDNLMSINVLNQAKENQVEIIGLPGHLKRIKSPLESGIFNAIKVKFSQVAAAMKCVDSANAVPRHKLPMLFSETVDQACMPGYIKSVFKKSGIYPLDASVCTTPLVSSQTPIQATPMPVTATTSADLPSLTSVITQPPPPASMFDTSTYNSCMLQPHVSAAQQLPPPAPPHGHLQTTLHSTSSSHLTSTHLASSHLTSSLHLTSAHLATSSHLTSSPQISTSHVSHVHHAAAHLPTASQLASSHLSSSSHISHLTPSASQLSHSQLQYYTTPPDTSHPVVRNLQPHVPELFLIPSRQYNDEQSNRAVITSATNYTEEVMPRPSVVLTNEDYLAEMVTREDAEKRAIAVGMVGMHNRHMIVPHIQTQPQQQQQQQQQQQHLSQFAKKRMKSD